MQRPWRLCLPALSFVLLVVFALTPNARVKADDDNDRESPVGTWILTATLDTPPGSPPFVVTNLIAINPGGTFTITDNVFNAYASGNPFLPPPFVVDNSDGYGSWERRGSSQFATTFKRFLFAGAKTDPAIYGSFFVGQQVGEGTIQGINTLKVGKEGDTWRGPFTFQARNLRGEVVAAGSGTVSATRLKIEPLAMP